MGVHGLAYSALTDTADFPALGWTANGSNNPNNVNNAGGAGASYASQAGGLTPQRPVPGQQTRDLTVDDFPALGAPPGMLSLTSTEKQRTRPNGAHPQASHFAQNGSSHPLPPNSSTIPHSHPTHNLHPQTPAQQVLVSAADRWGLLGLLLSIKNAGADPDGGLSAIGTDLGTMGLDMGYIGDLYSTFITPWTDQSAARSVEPDFHLPACYNVAPPPPGPAKVAGFSDETLFFMFYSSPRDVLQEVAAMELYVSAPIHRSEY